MCKMQKGSLLASQTTHTRCDSQNRIHESVRDERIPTTAVSKVRKITEAVLKVGHTTHHKQSPPEELEPGRPGVEKVDAGHISSTTV